MCVCVHACMHGTSGAIALPCIGRVSAEQWMEQPSWWEGPKHEKQVADTRPNQTLMILYVSDGRVMASAQQSAPLRFPSPQRPTYKREHLWLSELG